MPSDKPLPRILIQGRFLSNVNCDRMYTPISAARSTNNQTRTRAGLIVSLYDVADLSNEVHNNTVRSC